MNTGRLGAFLRWLRRLAYFEVRFTVDRFRVDCWEVSDDGFTTQAGAMAMMYQRMHEYRRDPRQLQWRVRREIILRTTYLPARRAS